MDASIIGNRIKIFRKNKGLTQKKLANQIDKSERMIQKYESGEITPSIEVCQIIANKLEVNIDKIIGESAEDKIGTHSIEIIFEFIERFFITKGEIATLNKMNLLEQQELAININSLLENKIDIKNGLFDSIEQLSKLK